MRVELFFGLYAAQKQGNEVITGNQIGFVAFYENSSQQEIGGFTGMVTSGYDWIVSDINNKILQRGSAKFNINVLTLVNPKDGDMYIKGFSFMDQMNQNSEYEIYETKDNKLSYKIRFIARNTFAMFLPKGKANRVGLG